MADTYKTVVINGLEKLQSQESYSIQGYQVKLPNPQTGKVQRYWLIDEKLYEVQWHKTQYSSWLVGNWMYSDGGVYMFTLMDPTFILLGCIGNTTQDDMQGQSLYQEMDSMLEAYPEVIAQKQLFSRSFDLLCSYKRFDDQKYFKFDHDKAVQWLKCKIDLLRKGLDSLGVDNPLNRCQDEQQKLQYLIQFMGEYCKEYWIQTLTQSYGITEIESQFGTTTISQIDQPDTKRQKMNPKEITKMKQEQAKKNKLIKNSVGTQKISSFFKKK
eukprot:TRINITY_DN16626_c0_g1_i11.p2 TRINITY_DN16626_c0_g1~~TRINITY_DN16626_c0_g1_i11.p2  ORF type:complete len:270 (+),score=20.69 TRINITY_DN16626_c0_g1_i11:129-938(+)